MLGIQNLQHFSMQRLQNHLQIHQFNRKRYSYVLYLVSQYV